MEKESKFWKLGAISAFVIVGIILLRGCMREYQLAGNHRFTVAVTGRAKGGGFVEYEFQVNGINYKKEDRGWTLKPEGAKYFVKYYVNDPSLAKVVSGDEVPSCMTTPPPDGWLELPICR